MLLSLIFSLSLCAADDDEMKTEIKPGTNVSPAQQLVPAPSSVLPKPQVILNPKLRAQIRSKAPFWIDDSHRGAPIRINKDGTFSSEAHGGGAIAGSWRALRGELEITWSDGSEKYRYALTTKGKALLINGRSAKSNRYKLD